MLGRMTLVTNRDEVPAWDCVAAGDSPAPDSASEPDHPSRKEGAPFLTSLARTGARPAYRVYTSSRVIDHRHQLYRRLSISVVPKNLKRYFGAGDLHFITGSCYHRQPRLGSAFRRDLFFTVLDQVRHHCAFVVLGYVLMPEHFHLVVSEPQRGSPSGWQVLAMKVRDTGNRRRSIRFPGPLLAKCARNGAPIALKPITGGL
jgi:hypothetical protein